MSGSGAWVSTLSWSPSPLLGLATRWLTPGLALGLPVPSPRDLLEAVQATDTLTHPPLPALALPQNFCPVFLLASPGHPHHHN